MGISTVMDAKRTLAAKTILEMRDEVIGKYGPWHVNNVYLQDDIYTIGPRIVGDEIKLRRIVQCVLDHTGGKLDGLRVLDLGCGEGIYSIEFARQGASCVAIEGREPNAEKVRFVKRVLSLDNLEVLQEDVRNLSPEKHGYFDVVLCLGILYHLTADEVFDFVGKLHEVCRKICIVDTRVELQPKSRYIKGGDQYWGKWGEEHWPGDSKEVKLARLGASLDNEYNFWLSRPSLYNLLSHVGFTSIYECNIPAEPKKPADRFTFVAIKGQPCQLLSAPLVTTQPAGGMPERPIPEHSKTYNFLSKTSHLLPWRTRRFGKKLLGMNRSLRGI